MFYVEGISLMSRFVIRSHVIDKCGCGCMCRWRRAARSTPTRLSGIFKPCITGLMNEWAVWRRILTRVPPPPPPAIYPPLWPLHWKQAVYSEQFFTPLTTTTLYFFIFIDFSTSLRTLAVKKLSVFGIGPLHHWGGVTLSCAPHFPTKYPSSWSSCTFSLRVVYQGFMFSLFASAGMCLPFLKGAGLYSV